jgi:hypothetical protein
MDNMMGDILVNLADYYPQTSAAGQSPRMRDVITEVYRIDDEENDFIFANKLKIADFIQS